MDKQSMYLPPHDMDAEEAILGSILIDSDALVEVDSTLEANHFFREAHNWLYEAMQQVYRRGEPVDFITVRDALMSKGRFEAIGGENMLINLINATPTSMHAKHYANIVSQHATRRKLISAAQKIAASAYELEKPVDEVVQASQAHILNLEAARLVDGVKAPATYVQSWLDAYFQRADGKSAGVPSGYVDLDRMTNGFVAPHVYVLAGRPGMGKSALGLGAALNAAIKKGKRVLFFSAEMNDEQLMDRAVSSLSGVNHEDIRRGNVSPHDEERFFNAAQAIRESDLIMDFSPVMTPARIAATAMRINAQRKIDLLVIDHLHRLAADRAMNNRALELGEMMRQIVNAARQVNVPILLLAQLSRGVESRADKRPMLSDLRDSGTIEEEAHTVMFLYRDAYYEGDLSESPDTGELSVAKNRDGKTGIVHLYWDADTVSYRNLQTREVEL